MPPTGLMMVGGVGERGAPEPAVRIVERGAGGPGPAGVDEGEPAHRAHHLAPLHGSTLVPAPGQPRQQQQQQRHQRKHGHLCMFDEIYV